jgi:glycosyltransferase involved in cell wall biosynthesis
VPAPDESNKPHVCMVVHAYYPLGEPRVEREARAAVDAGYTVDVVCLRATGEPAFETIDDIRVTRLPVEHVRGAGARQVVSEYADFTLRAARATLRMHRRHPIDVVHVHAPPDFLILSAIVPRLRGSGVMLDIHDLSPDMFDVRFGGRRLAGTLERCLRLVERAACSVADRVLTVHEAYRRELTAHGVPSERIEIVMNAPDDEAIERARAAAAPVQPDSFVVAYHGTLTHWYGVDLLVEAIARLQQRVPKIRGLILGAGDALAPAEELAERLGVADRIEFSRTYLPHDEALRVVAAASCGVIPNRRSRLNRFALSSKLLEYVALGIPVVVAELETLRAHFSPTEVTFFEPDDAESLTEAIAWVAEHPEEAREKLERARERADGYSWPASRTRLLASLAAAVPRKRYR